MKKKLLAFLLAFALILPLSSFPVSARISGDVDGDGAVTLRDSAIIARHAGGWAEYVLPDGGITFPGAEAASSGFSSGFGKCEITPAKSVPLAGVGNSVDRLAKGAADPLYATAVALRDQNGVCALLISLDLYSLPNEISDLVRTSLAEKFQLAKDAVILSCTHTGSGPDLETKEERTENDVNRYLISVFLPGVMKAAESAFADLARSDISLSSAYTDSLNSVRRRAVSQRTA